MTKPEAGQFDTSKYIKLSWDQQEEIRTGKFTVRKQDLPAAQVEAVAESFEEWIKVNDALHVTVHGYGFSKMVKENMRQAFRGGKQASLQASGAEHIAGLEQRLPAHKAALHITHNDHKTQYMSAAEYADEDWIKDAWVSAEEKQKAIDTDSIWELQWYPDTPIGFYKRAASTFEALLEALPPELRGK